MHSVLVDKETREVQNIQYDSIVTSPSTDIEVIHVDSRKDIQDIYNSVIPKTDFTKSIFIERYALGDIIMLLPILNSLKKTYPNQKINLFTDEWLQPLLTKLPFIDNLVNKKTLTNSGGYLNLEGRVDFLTEENKHRSLYFLEYIIKNTGLSCNINWNFNFEFEECFERNLC